MSDINMFDCVRCGGEHPVDGPIDCPADSDSGSTTDEDQHDGDEDDGADDDQDHSVEELRSQAVEEIDSAHVAAIVCVRFPTGDNAIEEMQSAATTFYDGDELSKAQTLAARTVVEQGLEDLKERYERTDTSSKPRPVGMPISLSSLLGGSEQNQADPDGWGFQ